MFSNKIFLLLCTVCFVCINNTQAQDTSKTINISGYAEIYYLYNFNKPINNNQPSILYSYNRSNEVNLNLGFAKATYSTSKVRANLTFMAGTYTVANLAAEPAALRHIYEADIGVKLSSKNNLWLDVGIMPSHIGFESAIGKDCYNVTRSILAENTPYYEAGLKLVYTSKNEKWFAAALLLNGWQRIKRPDGNTTPAFGTQITYKPASSITLNSSTFLGNDKPDSTRQMRYFHNFYGIFQLNKKFSLITGFDIGAEQKSKGSSAFNSWYSPILVARYNVDPKWTAGARVEYYYDKKGVLISTGTSSGFKTLGYSANIDYTLHENAIWRIEVRSLNSKDKIFEKSTSSFSSTTTWIVTSLAISL